MDGKNFIITTDKETAGKLEQEGLKLINKEGNKFTFLNNKAFAFSKKEGQKIVYTNMLSV